jgi:hypothetical protein
MAATLLIAIGIGLLGFAGGVLISVAVLLAGMARDGFMAITMTAIIEVKGVGARLAGSATGLAMSALGAFNFFAPPVGNGRRNLDLHFHFCCGLRLCFQGSLPISS